MYLPEAFQKKMKAILGEEYDDFLAGFEKPRHYGLRVNTAKITPPITGAGIQNFSSTLHLRLKYLPSIRTATAKAMV